MSPASSFSGECRIEPQGGGGGTRLWAASVGPKHEKHGTRLGIDGVDQRAEDTEHCACRWVVAVGFKIGSVFTGHSDSWGGGGDRYNKLLQITYPDNRLIANFALSSRKKSWACTFRNNGAKGAPGAVEDVVSLGHQTLYGGGGELMGASNGYRGLFHSGEKGAHSDPSAVLKVVLFTPSDQLNQLVKETQTQRGSSKLPSRAYGTEREGVNIPTDLPSSPYYRGVMARAVAGGTSLNFGFPSHLPPGAHGCAFLDVSHTPPSTTVSAPNSHVL